ncbi:MAG: hypothetical protein E4H00_05335 [Myxococcales bacterium]|nr:MAG: hypothetical protein E4H00_05335 [Myxococcales bacterium]
MAKRFHQNILRASLGVVAAAALVASAPCGAEAQISTAVRKNDPTLGLGSDLRKFRGGVVSAAAGQRLVFRATVRDASGGRKGIVRTDAGGAGAMVVERGDTAPGSGATFRSFLQPSINASSDVAWFGFLSGGLRGIYRTVSGSIAQKRLVAVTGVASPLSPGVFLYDDFGPPEITNTAGGVVVYFGSATTEEGIFACAGGDGNCVSGSGVAWTLIRTGDVVSGREICEFEDSVRVSDYGVAFRAKTRVNCSSSSEALLAAVMRLDFADTVGPEIVALVGNPTDLGPTVPYSRFRDTPTINDGGTLAFRGDVSGGGTISEAVFRCDPGAGCPATALPVSVVDKGQIVGGSELRRFSSPQIANNGDIVFQSRPKGGTTVGRTLYVRRAGGAIQLVATGGSPVDEPGATLRRVGTHYGNSGGTIVFRSTVQGPPWKVGLFLWQP